MDYSLPGSSVHEISQTRVLEWVAISCSRGSSQKGVKPVSLSQAGGFFTTELPEKPMTNNISYAITAAAAAKSLQSCPTLCNPIDGSPPGSPTPGILQARILEWVAISFSSAWKWKMKAKPLSCVRLAVTPWTAAYQAPPSMGFSRQEYWSGVPLPSLNSFLLASYSLQAIYKLNETHPHWLGQPPLLSLPIQILISYKNILLDTPRHSLQRAPCVPSRHIKLIITVSNLHWQSKSHGQPQRQLRG